MNSDTVTVLSESGSFFLSYLLLLKRKFLLESETFLYFFCRVRPVLFVINPVGPLTGVAQYRLPACFSSKMLS